MGLAPYGEPKYLREVGELISLNDDGTFALNLDYFIHHKTNIQFEWTEGAPKFVNLYSSKLITLLGPARSINEPLEQKHKDIAKSAQVVYETALFHLLNFLHKKYKIDNLTLAGGCALNSVANGKIKDKTPFKNIFIQPAAGDSGGAIGAAIGAAANLSKKNDKLIINGAYWGPGFTSKEIESLIQEKLDELNTLGCSVEMHEYCEINKILANAISKGNVVGWFQDRMEWGSRALGNRSILADPRRHDIKDILNAKIKRRESFRPFAPSILREHVFEWFKNDCDVPYMTEVIEIKEDKRGIIPAVTHVDGTGRLQTVTKADNHKYYELIDEFYKLTGVPILLNTSFNENEPIVCTPIEAYNCFKRTKMDILVLGMWIIKRNN